uniref:Putative conserved plasma membrane protein n=1 Tax=Nyssomyia neivai TaxID=330878 RepID=A0A1L8D9E3_9DIPT
MSQTSQTSEFPSAPEDDSVEDLCKKTLKSRIFLGEFREKRLVPELNSYRDVIVVSARTEAAIANDLDIVHDKLVDLHAGGDVQWIGLTRNTGQRVKGLESVSVWTELDSFHTFGTYWFQIKTIRFRSNEILLKLKVLRSVDDVVPQQDSQELPFKWEDIDWPVVEQLGRHIYTWTAQQARSVVTSLLSIRISMVQVVSYIKMFIFLAITAVVSLFHVTRAIGEFGLRFITESRRCIHTLMPLFLGIIDFFTKIVGGFYMLIAMVWRDSINLRGRNNLQALPAPSRRWRPQFTPPRRINY